MAFARPISVLALVGGCLLVAACGPTGTATPVAPTHPIATATGTAVPTATAAGDSTGPTSAATTTDGGGEAAGGCPVSRQDAVTMLGGNGGVESGDAVSCSYQTGTGVMNVKVNPLGGESTDSFAVQRSTASALPGYREVTGVGEGAFVSIATPSAAIEFLTGANVVVIVVLVDPSPSIDALTSLAQSVASRM